ncbi:hypothetical protein JHK86_056526 [Glycine max]|nr:hypothetical protein JHK86_056526 [Glycine max]
MKKEKKALALRVLQEGAAGSLEHVVGHVQDPEADDEDGDGAGAGFFGQGVAEHVLISGISITCVLCIYN